MRLQDAHLRGQGHREPQLVERHTARLRGFCAKLVGDVRRGEEIAQDCWLSTWEARERYRADQPFAAYLFTAARNLCPNDARAGRRREKVIDPRASVADGATDAAKHLDALLVRERRQRVLAAIFQLPEALRKVLVLRVAEELDYPAIARIVGRTESAVRSRVHFGIRALRDALREELP